MPIIHDPKLPFQLWHPTQCYPDTTSVFIGRRELPERDTIIKDMQAVNHGKVWAEPMIVPRGLYGYNVIMQAGSPDALSMLDDYQRRYDGKLNRLDLAIDLFPDPYQRLACRDWVDRHLTLTWRKAGPMYACGEVSGWVYYVGSRAPTRNAKLYCDRTSKLNNRITVHSEINLRTSRTLMALDLYRVSDVMKINPTKLLPRVIKLFKPHESGTPAQLLYDDREEREWLKEISLDVLGLPQVVSYVRLRKQKMAG